MTVGLGMLYSAGTIIKAGQLRGSRRRSRHAAACPAGTDSCPWYRHDRHIAGLGSRPGGRDVALRRPKTPARLLCRRYPGSAACSQRNPLRDLGLPRDHDGMVFSTGPFFTAVGITAAVLVATVIDHWAWPRGGPPIRGLCIHRVLPHSRGGSNRRRLRFTRTAATGEPASPRRTQC